MQTYTNVPKHARTMYHKGKVKKPHIHVQKDILLCTTLLLILADAHVCPKRRHSMYNVLHIQPSHPAAPAYYCVSQRSPFRAIISQLLKLPNILDIDITMHAHAKDKI